MLENLRSPAILRCMATPTIRDLARLCGLSPSGVSAALRNKKNVSPATREKVRLAALKIGYSNDARVSQLMAYLRSNKSSRTPPSLVLLYKTELQDDLFIKPWLSNYLSGITSRCEKFGYILDTIWTGDSLYTPKRINSILQSRGVEGIIIFHPSNDYPSNLGIQLDQYAVCAIEGDHAGREFPRVVSMTFENMRMAVDRLLTMGYQRPGLLLGEWVNDNNDECWRAGFIESSWKFPVSQRIPPLIDERWRDKLRKWLEKYRPDVIICCEAHVRDELQAIGYNVPQDIALLHVNLGPDVPAWAGIDNLHSEIGSASVDVVVAQIHRGETGIPAHTKTIQLRGVWCDGETCPPKNASSTPQTAVSRRKRAKAQPSKTSSRPLRLQPVLPKRIST